MPDSKEVQLILVQLQDCGLITMANRSKNCDVTYYDYGIKIHDSLMNLYDEKDSL